MPDMSEVLEIRIVGKDDVSHTFRSVSREIDTLDKTSGRAHTSTSKLGGTLGLMRSAIGPLTVGIGALGAGIAYTVKQSSDWESMFDTIRANTGLTANQM